VKDLACESAASALIPRGDVTQTTLRQFLRYEGRKTFRFGLGRWADSNSLAERRRIRWKSSLHEPNVALEQLIDATYQEAAYGQVRSKTNGPSIYFIRCGPKAVRCMPLSGGRWTAHLQASCLHSETPSLWSPVSHCQSKCMQSIWSGIRLKRAIARPAFSSLERVTHW